MVATQSNMLPLGTIAPSFSLLDPRSKKFVSFSTSLKAKGFMIGFICNHCPYVIHLKNHFPLLFNSFVRKDIKVFLISSNDHIKYPDDSPEKMAVEADKLGFEFPYLFDADQKVAKSYQAACTPDFFLFNHKKELFYRGQYDGSRPGNNINVTGGDISNAVNQMLKDENPPKIQIPSIGCNIKWKTD